MTIKDFVKKKLFGNSRLAGIPTPDDDRSTFINNEDEALKSRLKEYDLWYYGDSDELLNYYTYYNTVEYNYEPYYNRNKRNYFWAISSTEGDIKRTHSGQPHNIIDTLVGICRFPTINVKGLDEENRNVVNQNIKKIIEDSGLKDVYKEEQLPLCLVEGWGCYKINWNDEVSDYPYAVYYRAENVDFITKGNRVCSVIFKDYYTDTDGKRFLLLETRSIKYDKADKSRYLSIEYNLMKYNSENSYTEVPLSEFPELTEATKNAEISHCDMLLAVPCILFKNTGKTLGPGRSIFTGKIDLFDDLDQALSQSSNSVRKSTPVEYFNSEFLERDNNGMPIQPKAYDRKYTIYQGQPNSEGEVSGLPVQISQPNIDFSKYSQEAIDILLQIINGIMSPATMGIDIAKKDNADAQREKEKVTIFCRNRIIDSEQKILKSLCSQLLCAYEFMRTGEITVKEYEVSVKFSEFADVSFENKLEVLGKAFDAQTISEDMYMDKLYGDTLTEKERADELEWLKQHHTKLRDGAIQQGMGGGANIAAEELGKAPQPKQVGPAQDGSEEL